MLAVCATVVLTTGATAPAMVPAEMRQVIQALPFIRRMLTGRQGWPLSQSPEKDILTGINFLTTTEMSLMQLVVYLWSTNIHGYSGCHSLTPNLFI